MRRILAFFVASFFLLSFASPAYAAIVTISTEKEVVWNVLGISESLKIVSLPDDSATPAPGEVSLSNVDGKTTLEVETENGKSTKTDVTELKDDLVEIEQKDSARRIKITVDGDSFVINQGEISSKTTFPISINSKIKEISVHTPTGEQYIKVFPGDAVENSINASLIDTLSNEDKKVELVQGEEGELIYKIPGEKNINLFNLFETKAPVELTVSATSGKLITLDEPKWLELFGFILKSRR